jgi:hypothetical protein
MFSIARKLGTIEERRRDQKYLFRREDYRSQDRNLDKLSGFGSWWFFCSLETENDKKKRPQSQICVLRRGYYKKKGLSHAIFPGSNQGEDDFCNRNICR